MVIYAVDSNGRYLGSFTGGQLTDGAKIDPVLPNGAIGVSQPPPHPKAIWNGSAWDMTAANAAIRAEKAASVREERDRLLAESDWTQLPDAPITASMKTAWATYRQNLRDITAQQGFPDNVVWPVAPM